MTSQRELKEQNLKLPAPGIIFVRLLKKNKTVPCLVIRVGKVNSTVEIKGVETKVPNEDVDIDSQDDEGCE